MKKNEIIIYTDGSSLGNPGPGGWGAVVILNDGKVIELGARDKDTTNNRMELAGAIEALKEIQKRKPKAKKILVHTDSNYVLNGITMWIYAWVKNGWITKTKEQVLNRDLWEELYKIENNLKYKYEISWQKVSGHAGVHLNERCDKIATELAAGERIILFRGNLKDYEKLFGKISKDHTKTDPNKLAKKKNNKGEAYAYVSCVNGKIHSDKTWGACENRVKGKSRAKYKKVFSREEEQDLIALWSLKSLF